MSAFFHTVCSATSNRTKHTWLYGYKIWIWDEYIHKYMGANNLAPFNPRTIQELKTKKNTVLLFQLWVCCCQYSSTQAIAVVVFVRLLLRQKKSINEKVYVEVFMVSLTTNTTNGVLPFACLHYTITNTGSYLSFYSIFKLILYWIFSFSVNWNTNLQVIFMSYKIFQRKTCTV